MPDWREIVRARLRPLGMDAEREEEIITELAGHLEDLYEDLLRRGKPESEAAQFALSTAADWDEVRREIQVAANEEVIMNYRVKTLWLPGACTAVLSSVVLWLFQTASAPTPHVFWPGKDIPVIVYWQWWLCLPFIGALGAYWSRRAGGKLLQGALAVSFPVLGPMGLPILILPFMLAFQGIVRHNPPLVPAAFLLLGWVVVPEAALLLGALPFLGSKAVKSGQAAASH